MINKKILVTLSATTAIFFMLLSPSITSYAAEDQDSTVKATDTTVEVGNVTITDGSSAVDADNSNVTVDQDSTGTATNTTVKDKDSTVTATNTTVEVGNVTTDGGTSAVVANNSTVNVQGNITTSGATENGSYQDNDGAEHLTASPAVVATNESTVKVDGDIKAGTGTSGAEQTAITATNGSTVTVTGDVSGTKVGIESYSSEVTVGSAESNRTVSGSEIGVSASNGSTITVYGDVINNGIQTDITNSETGKVSTSYTGTGVYSYGENTITITGDVSSVENGVCINLGDTPLDDNNGEIIIGGTVVGGIVIYDNGDSSTFSTQEEILNSTPEITVYAIDYSDSIPIGLHFNAYDWSTKADEKVLNGIKADIGAAINYIIKVNETSAEAYGITVSGDNITQKGDYQTVNIYKDFTVAATLSEGYTISGGKNVLVTDNHDGTFTLTLTDPYYGYTISGGIYVDVIEVKVIPVTNTDGSTTIVVEPEPVTETYTEPYNDPTQAPAGSIVVTTNTGNDTSTSEFTTAISGDKPAQTISFTMSSVTPQQYKNAIISSVASVPSNGAFNIVTDTIGCLDAGMIEALSARPDIDVNIVFYYGGKQMKVTIPAGYDLNSLLDENGYCGFLRLMSILGGTEI